MMDTDAHGEWKKKQTKDDAFLIQKIGEYADLYDIDIWDQLQDDLKTWHTAGDASIHALTRFRDFMRSHGVYISRNIFFALTAAGSTD